MCFSIIIPVYNKEKGIKETINSILNQSYTDYEVVVVDDGSTDDSISVIHSIKSNKIHVYKQENSGPSAARNRGIREAKGEWILFLDADDELEPDALKTFNRLIKQSPEIKCFFCNFYIESNGIKNKRTNLYSDGIVGNNFRAWFFSRLFSCQGSYVLSKNVALRHPFPVNIRRWEDACMLFDILREETVMRCSIPVFTYHRSLSEASSRRKDPKAHFICNVVPKGKSFWERLCLYRMYIMATKMYPDTAEFVYGKHFDVWYIKGVYILIEGMIDFLTVIKHKIIG